MKIKKAFFKKQKKIILGYSVLSIFILLMFFIYVLYEKNSFKAKRMPSVLGADSPGVLSLEPGEINVALNDPVISNTASLNVALNTGGENVFAVDVVLEFEPAYLSVTDPGITVDPSTSLKTFAPVVSEADPSFDWSKAVNGNRIEFGAVAFDLVAEATTSAFNGIATLAAVNLQALPVRRDTSTQVSVIAQVSGDPPEDVTDDSNIVVINPDVADVIKTSVLQSSTIKIKAQPECRAAIDLADKTPGSNDLQLILSQWRDSCSGCFEDLNEDGNISSGDLQYLLNFWGSNACPF